MALLTIVIDVADSAQDLADKLKLDRDPRFALGRLGAYIDGANEGRGSQCTVNIGGNRASSTITFTGAPSAGQTCSINSTAFTARASGAVGNEFNIGATIEESAANLAAAVNASVAAAIRGVMRATSSGGVVTLTAVVPRSGTQGITSTTTAMTNTSTSGAFTGGANIAFHYRIDVGRV